MQNSSTITQAWQSTGVRQGSLLRHKSSWGSERVAHPSTTPICAEIGSLTVWGYTPGVPISRPRRRRAVRNLRTSPESCAKRGTGYAQRQDTLRICQPIHTGNRGGCAGYSFEFQEQGTEPVGISPALPGVTYRAEARTGSSIRPLSATISVVERRAPWSWLCRR